MITPHDVRVMSRDEKLRLLQLLHDDLMADAAPGHGTRTQRIHSPRIEPRVRAISWEEPSRMLDEDLSRIALNS